MSIIPVYNRTSSMCCLPPPLDAAKNLMFGSFGSVSFGHEGSLAVLVAVDPSDNANSFKPALWLSVKPTSTH